MKEKTDKIRMDEGLVCKREKERGREGERERKEKGREGKV